MNILNESLFASDRKRKIGAGFHNIGSGVLRASNKKMVDKLEAHYGERCGHIPFDAEKIRVLVDIPTPAIEAQVGYLSQLFGKEIKAVTFEALRRESGPEEHPLVVPYVNVPETEQRVRETVGGESWGIPAKMVHILKNKADFYHLVDELDLSGFRTPDYTISTIYDLHTDAWKFLARIEALYSEAGVAATYPLGLVLRAAESDGNYGSSLLYARGGSILLLQDGDADGIQSYQDWNDALLAAQKNLMATMNLQKETRIVISRFVDMVDSPGMSVVLLEGHVESLRWNGQLQGPDSKACVGTSTYIPKNALLRDLQLRYEDQTCDFFTSLLKQTATKYGIDFSGIRGIANIDIILSSEMELDLQRRRKQTPTHFLAECNPRWTNYTDAIMTIMGVNKKEPTVNNMRTVIREGIFTIDKSFLPGHVDPALVREYVCKIDDILKQDGTRIICRMTKNPMGLIFAGDVQKAQQEFDSVVAMLAEKGGQR
ncbi:MAG: hypothetical protein JO031_11575 [Ktedonobacteraceae bacterium]|nr:hypothetical protein [Ktedonobacteraceae bacterium]